MAEHPIMVTNIKMKYADIFWHKVLFFPLKFRCIIIGLIKQIKIVQNPPITPKISVTSEIKNTRAFEIM